MCRLHELLDRPLLAGFDYLSGAGSALPWAHRLWLRLLWSFCCIGALSFALAPLVGSAIHPHFAPEDDASAFFEKLFVAAWWLLVASSAIAGGQIALRINRQHHAPRLIADLAAAAIYLGAMLAILDLAFGVSVTGLVATSGIIAIVLGLALQNTLGDLFSGIAIGIDRPFNVGDLILIEGSVEGRVVETNWRSTRIATANNDIATVPNSVVAKSRITNRSVPSEAHMRTVKIVVDPTVPPAKAIALLRASAFNATLISPTPPLTVSCTELRGDGVTYEINFSAPLSILDDARSDLLQQVARHARYNGVALASQNGAPIIPVVAPDVLQLVSDTLIFQALSVEDRIALTSNLVERRGQTGEAIFTQGGSAASLFMIARGAFDVTRDAGGGPRGLGTLGPGDYFGELSLLTGTANAATITALTPFLTYEVTKAMVAPFLERNPDLLHALEDAASKAQALLERGIAAQASPGGVSNIKLIDRIRAFFAIEENNAGFAGAQRPWPPGALHLEIEAPLYEEEHRRPRAG